MTMGTDPRPSWLHEACPSWCTRTHREDDHVDDRRHQGDGELFAVFTADGAVPGRRSVRVDVVMHLDRPVGGLHDWLRIEGTETALRLAVRRDSVPTLLARLELVAAG